MVAMYDSALNHTLHAIPTFSDSGFREWRSNIRQAILYHKHDMLPVRDVDAGQEPNAAPALKHGPKPTVNFTEWCSSRHTRPSAHTRVTSAQGSLLDGAAAWAALSARLDLNTTKSRRACREKLVNTVM